MSNKYQFGTVMPGQQPVQYQYTPLGLEAFAQPLAMKQQRYDTITSAIEDAKFDIKSLNVDNNRALEITNEIENRKNELLDELGKTKNFSQAAKKLKQLNNIYNEDEEITALRTQHAAFLDADEKAKERVKNKDWSEQDYREWRFKTLREYSENGGLNFNRNTKVHNQINTDLRGKNLENEIMNLAKASASQTPLQIQESLSAWGDVDNETMQQIQTLLKERNLNQVSSEVANFLKQSKRYKDWVNESADYSYFWESRHDPNFKEKTIGATYGMYDQGKQYYIDVINNPNANSNIKREAQSKLIELEQEEKQFNNLYNQAVANDKLDEFAESVYKENASTNRLSNIAQTAADLFDTKSLTYSTNTRSNDAAKASREKVNKINEYQVDTQALSFTRKSNFTQGEGSSASQVIEGDAFDQHQRTLYKDMNIPHKGMDEDNIYEATTTNVNYNAMSKESHGAFNQLYKATQDYGSLLRRTDKWDKEIDNINSEILDLQSNINTGSIEEQRETRSKLNKLQQDLREAKVSYEGEFHFINSLLQEKGKEKENEWINDAYLKGGQKEVFQQAYNRNLALMKESQRKRHATREGNVMVTIKNDDGTTTQKTMYDSSDEFKNLQNSNKIVGARRISGKDRVVIEDEWRNNINNNIIGNDILNTFRTSMTRKYATAPTEVVINEQSNNYTSDYLDKLVRKAKENEAGTHTAAIPITFNSETGTGERKLTSDNKMLNYNIDYYNNTPSYVGTSTVGGSNRPIIRYNREKMTDGEIKTLIAKNDGTLKAEDVSQEKVEAFKKNNPRELYLSVEGSSIDIEREAQKTFTELAEASINSNDPYAFEVSLNSFAAIDLISDNQRRVEYGQMTATLKDAMLHQNPQKVISQAPFYWHDNGNGTYTGNQITYQYDPEHKAIVANISQLTYGNGIEGTKVVPLTTKIISELNAQNLRGIDIIYGVGDERDRVVNPRTQRDFIPAFYNPQVMNY